MDPVTIFNLVGTVVDLTSKSAKIVKDLNRLARKYRETKSTLQKIVNECQILEAAASQIKLWIEVKLVKMSPKYQQQMGPLRNALRDFAALLEPLDADVTSMLNKAESSRTLPFSVKFSSLWNEDKMKEHLDDLRWQANAIHFLLSATQLLPQESIKQMESIAHNTSMFREGSLFNDSGSTLDDVEFEFDRLLINTATYRRALNLLSQRRDNPSRTPYTRLENDDIASYITLAKREGDGMTAIHLASERGQIEVLRECIEAGFNTSLKIRTKGWTPLHYAAENSHESAVKLLLEKGAENVPDNHGRTPLHLVARKVDAGHIANIFLQKLDCGKLPVERSGYTPLHHAAAEGHSDIMIHLAGPGVGNTQLRNGFTPLHSACKNSHVQCAKILLESGVDVNLKHVQFDDDIPPWSCLGYAIYIGNLELVQLLLHHDASQEMVMGGTCAFKVALYSGNIEIIKLLAVSQDMKVQSFPVESARGTTGIEPALHYAVRMSDKIAVIKWLLDHGYHPNGQDTWGNTALHEAATKGNVKLMALLLQHGGDLNAQNNTGYTPLNFATTNGMANMVSFLLEKGASPFMKGKNGKALIDSEFYHKMEDGTRIDEEMKEKIRGLLRSVG